MLRTLLGLGLPLVLGLPFTLALTSWPARLGMAFLSGVVIIAVGLTFVGVAGLRFSPLTVAPLGVVWLVPAFLAARAHRAEWWTASWRPSGLGPVPLVLLMLAAINVATAAAYALKTPATIYDVSVIWLPKAQLLAAAGFAGLKHSVFPDYPPLWPLYLSVTNGGLPWEKILPTAFLLSALAVTFEYVRSRVGPVAAAACTLAISGVPYIWFPYGVDDLMADVPMMAFITASTLMIAGYIESGSVDRLALGAVSAIGVALTRPEGFVYALILCAMLAAVQFRRRRMKPALIPAAAVGLTYLGWQTVVRFGFGYHGTYRLGASLLNPVTDLRAVADTVTYAAVNVGNPYLFGPAVIAAAALVLGYRQWPTYGFIATVLALDLLAALAIYVALPATDLGEPSIWWLTTGFKRQVMHLIPLLYVSAALALGALRREPSALRSSTASASTSRLLHPAALLALTLVILAAGYAASTGGGPKAYDLSVMSPSHVYGPAVDYSTSRVMTTTTSDNTESQVIFYLQNMGRRIAPIDNATGTFTRFSARVEAHGPASLTEEFVASADGRQFAMAVVTTGSGSATVAGDIPLGTRLLELTVKQTGSGSSTVSWLQPTVYRGSLWWVVDAYLLLALVAATISAAVALGLPKLDAQSWLGGLNPAVIPVLLLAAAAVQQLEATAAQLVPSWAYAAQLIAHV